MPIYEIDLSDGRRVRVEANDPMEAKQLVDAEVIQGANPLEQADNFVRRAANAVSFGMGDRLEAFMAGGPGGYEEELAKSNARSQEAAQELGTAGTIAADLTGGALQGLALGPAAGPVKGLNMLGHYGSKFATPAGRALGYGAEGAVLGAANEVGNNYGDVSDKVGAAVRGAALGGGMGAVGSGAVDAVSAFRGSQAAKAAYARGERTPGEFQFGGAGNPLNRALEGVTPEQMNARFSEMSVSPEMTGLEFSPAVMGVGQGIESSLSPNAPRFEQFLRSRLNDRGRRLMDAAEDTFGAGKVPTRAAYKGNISARKKELQPEYDIAYMNAPEADLTNVTAYTGTMMADEGVSPFVKRVISPHDRELNAIAELGDPESQARRLHALRKLVGTQIAGIQKQIDTGSVNAAAAQTALPSLAEIRTRIDDVLKQNPAMAKADAAFQALSKEKNAYEIGNDLMWGDKKMSDPRDLEGYMKSLPGKQGQGPMPAEREALRSGATDKITRTLQTNPSDPANFSAMGKIIGGEDDATRRNLGMIFGDRNVEKMAQILQNEKDMANTYWRLFKNSDTAARNATQREARIGRGDASPDWAAPNASLWGSAVHALRGIHRVFRTKGYQEGEKRLVDALMLQGPEMERFITTVVEANGAREGIAEQTRAFLNRPEIRAAILQSLLGETRPVPEINVP